MKFSIGYNHDRELLRLVERYRDNVEALYFPIPVKYSGSGKHVIQNSGYVNEIPELINKCRSLHIKSQLLLNSTCDGESAYEAETFAEIIEYIRHLKELGLDCVIVANPLYIREIKKKVEGILIESSVNCYVKTAEHAQYLKDIGIDVLTLDRDINRNLNLIKDIKSKTGLKLRILLNEGCLLDCPYRKIHFNYISHVRCRPEKEMLGGVFFEKWGMELLQKNLVRMFRVPFIPPDALKYYTYLVDYFKIAGRDAETGQIECRLKAYIKQDYDGNLMAFLDSACTSQYVKYIDYKLLKEHKFFEKMLECRDECVECGFCEPLVKEAIVTESFFLDPSDPLRIEECERALRIFKRIVGREESGELSINKGVLYMNIAENYHILKRYEEALESAYKARESGLVGSKLNLLMGSCYMNTNKFERALEELKKAERIEPENPETSLYLSRYYQKTGQIELSQKELCKFQEKIRQRSGKRNEQMLVSMPEKDRGKQVKKRKDEKRGTWWKRFFPERDSISHKT